MSFSSETKSELCRAGTAKECCALAEAYGVLLYCHSFDRRRPSIQKSELPRQQPLQTVAALGSVRGRVPPAKPVGGVRRSRTSGEAGCRGATL